MSAEVQHTRESALAQAESFKGYLSQRADQDGENLAYEVAASQMARIIAADTLDEAVKATERDPIGSRDLTGVELRILSYTVHAGSAEINSPLGHFFMVRAVRLSDGEEFLFDTSAPLVMTMLRWLEAHEQLPFDGVIKVIGGRGTRTVLALHPIPKRAVNGKAESKPAGKVKDGSGDQAAGS